jgi:NADH:ubiquinone oxidoreductase subunit K
MKEFIDSLRKLKFKYSIVIILLTSLLGLVIFPSFNKSISDQHWSIINQSIGAVEVFLGIAIKHYFDNSKNEADNNKVSRDCSN